MSVLALSVMAEWLLRASLFIQIFPELVPMQFNAALCLLLCGLGLMTLNTPLKIISIITVSIAGLIAFVTGLQYIVDIDFGIDYIFIRHDINTPTHSAGRMPPNTALCYIMISFAILGWKTFKNTSFKQHLITPFILICLSLSGLSILGYIFDFPSFYGFSGIGDMSMQSATGIFALGVGFFVFILREPNFADLPVRRTGWIWCVFFTMMLGTFFMTIQIEKNSKEHIINIFEIEQKKITDKLTESLIEYERLLNVGTALYLSSEEVNRDEFHNYISSLEIEKNYPGVSVIGYAKIIDDLEKARYVDKQKKTGFPDFKIIPEETRSQYLIADFIEPYTEKNKIFHGYDLWSISESKELMPAIRDTSTVSVMRAPKHYQNWKKNHDKNLYLIFKPYFNTRNPELLAEKQDSKEGYIFILFFFSDIIKENLSENLQRSHVRMQVYDGDLVSDDTFLYDSGLENVTSVIQSNHPYMQNVTHYKFNNHEWTILYSTSINFNIISLEQKFALLIFLAGSAISILVFILLSILLNSKKQAEKTADLMVFKLAESEERYELAVKGTGVALWDWNVVSDEVYYAPRFREFLGYEGDDFQSFPNLFSSFENRLHPEDKAKTIKLLKDHLEHDVAYAIEYRLKNFSGEYLWFLARGQAIWGTDKTAKRMAGSIDDITERKALAYELENHRDHLQELVKEQTRILENAKNEAEKANRAKDDFLANMSHELRTPLNSILGLTKILLEDGLTDEQKQYLDVVYKASTSLLQNVNDILDLSKIEAGYIHLEYRLFNVAELMFSLIDQVKPLASKKGLVLNDNIAKMSSYYVMGDDFRLAAIVMNLMSNAIKYTEAGMVELRIDIKKIDHDKINFICQVKDTGIGIPKNKIEHIFEKFSQADETNERLFGGTGLGLSITKHLIELMQGTISVKSTINHGSTFTAIIPFDLAKEDHFKNEKEQEKNIIYDTHSNIKRTPIETATILVAEDHELNQIFISKLLQRLGCKKYKLVTDGVEVLKELDTNNYDMLLMDCHMPRMNGYDAAKAIRKKEAVKDMNEHIPIIAITADAMIGTKERCLEAGMDLYVSKPIEEQDLMKAVGKWFTLSEKKTITNRASKQKKSTNASPLNLKLIREYSNGDSKKEKELIDIFYKKTLADLETLKANCTDGQNKIWSETAHSLKGSAGYVGADKLKILAAEAQNLLDGGLEERKKLYKQIKTEHSTVVEYLKKNKFLS